MPKHDNKQKVQYKSSSKCIAVWCCQQIGIDVRDVEFEILW